VTLEPLYHAVAYLLVHIYYGISPVLGKNSGASWAASVILLTMAMRVILIPVFVKQIRSQRAMQAMQPRMKELQAKYKNDKERLNQEMMALWKETGTNPLAGCLPLVLQIPIFISLFHTLNKIKPDVSAGKPPHFPTNVEGFPQSLISSAAHAKIFGVPFAAAFNSSNSVLNALGGDRVSTRVLCAVLTIVMVASTFFTQRQLMARNTTTAADSTQAQTQKIMLYVLPLFFLFYGYRFPIGVLLYWLTTNLWSMGQQFIVLRRMDEAPTGAGTAAVAGPVVGAKPQRPAPGQKPQRPQSQPQAPPASGTPTVTPAPVGPRQGQPGPGQSRNRPSGNRRPSGRRNKRGRR
jgi:YidC/Oxa1 family membrane protein insertase